MSPDGKDPKEMPARLCGDVLCRQGTLQGKGTRTGGGVCSGRSQEAGEAAGGRRWDETHCPAGPRGLWMQGGF